jgi:hypothetical protein
MSYKLTTDDKETIKEFQDKFERALEGIERAKRMKEGDFLILYVWDYNGNKTLQVNSYGAPTKYKVVHSTPNGMPFIKTVNSFGTPHGQLFSVLGDESDSYRRHGAKFEFELDPDYADSILLDHEYDPAQLHKNRKEVWKAVTAHNKACKVKTTDTKDVVVFFKTVEIGHTLWTSAQSHYLVQGKQTMSTGAWNSQAKENFKTRVRGNVDILTIMDKKGKVQMVPPDFFSWKALYKERPRSYKELKS